MRPTLVLLHGFPMNASVWDGVRAQLRGEFDCVAVELFGEGDAQFHAGSSIDSVARGLLASLTKSTSGAIVVGLSLGGYIALAMAEQAALSAEKDWLRGIVLLDSRADADAPAAKQNRQKLTDLARSAGSVAVADEMLPKLLSPATVQRSPDVVRVARAMMEAVSPGATEAAQIAMRDRPDRSSLLTKLKIPLGVIVGADDSVTPPAVAQQMFESARAAGVTTTMENIQSAGHLAALEQAAAVATAIANFARTCER